MIFIPRYDPTASPSHVTWESSILAKKLNGLIFKRCMKAVSALMWKCLLKLKKMTSNDLLGSFLTSRGSSNLFEITKNYKHGRMMPIFAFLRNFSAIRKMTLNDLRGRKKIFWPWIQRGHLTLNKPCKWRPLTQKGVIHTRLRRAFYL